MHHPTDRITHTTAFVTPVVGHWLEREIAQWAHYMGKDAQKGTLLLNGVVPRQRCTILSSNSMLMARFMTGKGMNECLTTPQLKIKIGYRVSDKW